MRRTSLLITGLVLATALPALSQTPPGSDPAIPPAPKPAPTMANPIPPILAPGRVLLGTKDVMRHIVNPAAEAFWARSGEVDDEGGAHDRVSKDDENWKVTLDSAAQLVEAGNLLQMEGRARDASGPWMKYAIQLTNAGLAGMTAAQAKNHDKTNDAGSAMYDACYGCHGRYIVRPKDSLYTHDIDKDLKDAGVKAPK
jgi:cytochrome c553